jgi:hypothetical protein
LFGKMALFFAWQPAPNPTSTSQPIEISTGAADADSYHDFYRLRIAFADVWAELLDNDIANMGQQLYAMWDALRDTDPARYDDTGAADRLKRFPPMPDWDIAGTDELQNFLDNLAVLLGDQGTSVQAGMQGSISALTSSILQTLKGCNMLMHQMNRLVGQHSDFSSVWDTGQLAWSLHHQVTFGRMTRQLVGIRTTPMPPTTWGGSLA